MAKILQLRTEFLVIGNYWIAHHQTFRYVMSYDRPLLWMNLLFLLSISFILFPTALLGEYGELRFAVIFYAASVGLARLVLALEWWYIIKGPIRTSDDLDSRLARYNFFRGFAIPLIFLISIGISFLSVPLALWSWFVMFLADSVFWRFWRRQQSSSNG